MALLLWLLLLASGTAFCGEPPETAPPILTTEVNPEAYRSTRATYLTFLEAMAQVEEGDSSAWPRALAALDLSEINPLVRQEKGKEYAKLLYTLLEHKGPPAHRVPRYWQRERLTILKLKQGRVELVRQESFWRFSAETLKQLPELITALSEKEWQELPWFLRFRNKLSSFWQQKLFGLEYWQWVALAVLIVVGFLFERILRWFFKGISYLLYRWRLFSEALYREQPLRPLSLLSMAIFWWLGLKNLGLPADALAFLLVPVKVVTVLAAVWSGMSVVDLLTDRLSHYINRTETRLDDALLILFCKSLKVFLVVIGILFLAATLNINLVGLLAGLGLGGLAFALAARETVQNLFGSITILLDQTFHIGDWVIIDDVEGTVEEIGFRSTRIRTFYDSLVILPNAKLLTAKVDNMSRRRYRRLKCTLSLTYSTPPEKVEAFCEGLRELVQRHPYTRKDYYQIYCYELTPYSIDILIYIFFEVPNWGTELRERQRFLLDALRLAHKLKIEFAFPTQTLYLKTGLSGPPRPMSPQELLGEEAAREIALQGAKPPPARF